MLAWSLELIELLNEVIAVDDLDLEGSSLHNLDDLLDIAYQLHHLPNLNKTFYKRRYIYILYPCHLKVKA